MNQNKIGIIDVGSNTILGVVFRWDEERQSYRCFSFSDGKTIHAGLLQYVLDGYMTNEGLTVLFESLKELNLFFNEMSVRSEDISCFATASLRGVKNFAEASGTAKKAGFNLILLSGEEEARCDLAGMLQELNWMEQISDVHFPDSGVALDLGGGSGQLLCFSSRKNEKLEAFDSFPIGCLALKKKFIKGNGTSPTDEELMSIRNFVLSQIETIPMVAALSNSNKKEEKENQEVSPVFFAMGGTVKAIVRLMEFLGWNTGTTECVRISRQDLSRAEDYFRTENGRNLIASHEPGRKETLLTGTVVLHTICRRLGADSLTVLKSGVREGYVVRYCNPSCDSSKEI